ncbi:hypothetical protein ACG33_09985 [Steroidobacter denitrificans]|uniref:Helicase n=1 Tax=Steroidobacter denitrificans TaxID=465721 RepID=A0A127FCX1_STEDE|nr:DEAD/DEAH box helicase [Steroidobacter denitrificans]AMN47419.1 hypothetical protein ACG33_09985 [Steroidobacter denitrificans]
MTDPFSSDADSPQNFLLRPDWLRTLFGDRLYTQAQRWVEEGRVYGLRIAQAGRIITGFAAGAPSPDDTAGDERREPIREPGDGAVRCDARRVYIRLTPMPPVSRAAVSQAPASPALRAGGTDRETFQGECSCGARSPCVHIAAVSIAAAGRSAAASDPGRHSGLSRAADTPAHPIPAEAAKAMALHANMPAGTAPQQQLCYLLQPGTGGTQLSLWVGQRRLESDSARRARAEERRIDARGACAFVPRPTGATGEFPRYVDAQDRALLRELLHVDTDGPWPLGDRLGGKSGGVLLQRILATGRVWWRSLNGPPLRAGSPRTLPLVWEVLPSGDQQLRQRPDGTARSSGNEAGEHQAALELLLEVTPALCIDPIRNEWAALRLPYPEALLREHWNRPMRAQDVEILNEDIARQDPHAHFPRLRILEVRREPLQEVRARLLLGPGETHPASIHLEFLYNGLPVDSRQLRQGQATVRCVVPAARNAAVAEHGSGMILEIDRDPMLEQQLQERLEQALAQHAPGLAAADDASWLAFMMTGVPALQAAGWEIVLLPGFPYRLADGQGWYADIDAQRKEAWFDLRLGVVVDGRQINLLPALVDYLQGRIEAPCAPGASPGGSATIAHCRSGGQVLIRMEDGRWLPVTLERIERIANTLVELLDRTALNKRQALSLPVIQAGRLAQLSMALDGPAVRSNERSLLRLVEDLANFQGIRPLPAPAGFRAALRGYQQEGLGWLQFLRRYRLGGVLADDMGLGKTVQTIAHLLLEKAAGRLDKPALIVAPVSVIGNWQNELRRFAPQLKVLTLHGPRRKALFADIGCSDIVITGYPLLAIDAEVLCAHEFGFAILDEAQMIKNPRAKVSQAARLLRAEHRLCLTGTPMENHLGELWSLFDFLQPGLLGQEQQFQRHYRSPIEKSRNEQRREALARRIAPFVLRRTKDQVAKELPPKTQIVETLVLEERQRDFYDGIRLAMHRRVLEIIERRGLARSRITVLDALLRLRQACCDPRLVGTGAPNQDRSEGPDNLQSRNTDPSAEHAPPADQEHIPSAKMDWLRTVLPELVAEGRRILLFSQFTAMLALIEDAVKELNIPYCLLTGATRARDEVIQRFQAGDAPLFLISLKAGGTGLNLTAADTVIHYDPWWNPAVETQATDRAHRIGQDKPVFVYKLIAQGTVEEKILELQAGKHELASRLYSQRNASPAQLSRADLEALFT